MTTPPPPSPENILPDRAPEPMSRALRMQMLLRDTVKTKFFRQGFRMTIARAISLAVGMVGSIWAARCMGPVNLGISGMIMGTVSQLVLLGALNQNINLVRRYKNAKSPQEADDLISTAFTFRVLYACAIMIVAATVLLIVKVPPIWSMGIVAAFPCFLFGVNLPDWVLQGEGNMPACYMVGTLQAILVASLYFIFFRPGMAPGYDVIVFATGGIFYFALGWYLAVGKRKIKLFQPRLAPQMRHVLYDGRWLILTGIISYLLVSLELPLLGYLNSIKEVGIYRTATSISLGIQTFFFMISDLMYPRLIEWRNVGLDYLWSRQKKIFVVLAACMAPMAVGAFLFSPLFFHLFYGPAFQRAAFPCALLLFSRMVAVLTRVYSYGLMAQKQDRKLAKVTGIIAIFSVSANCLFIPSYGIYAASITNLVSETMALVLAFVVSRRIVKSAQQQAVPISG